MKSIRCRLSYKYRSIYSNLNMPTNRIGIWKASLDCNDTNHSDSSCVTEPLLVLGLVFDIFSILGSLFIIWTFLVFKDQRTRARLFLLFIAICDFFTSVGYGFALIWSLADKKFTVCHKNKPKVTIWACVLESGVDMYFPLCSFFWTVVLGFHILFLFFGKPIFKNKVVFVCLLVVGWGLPLLNTFVAFMLNILGPGPPTSTAGWCFINYNVFYNDAKNDQFHWIFEFSFAKFWDLLAMIVVVILYMIVFIRLCSRKFKKEKFSIPDFKLILIPFVFFILRIWGDTRWLIEVVSGKWNSNTTEYTKTCDTTIQTVLAYFQVIGDAGQGWANAILYLLFTKTIRERIAESFKRFFNRISKISSPKIRDNEREELVNEGGKKMYYY